MQPTEFRKRVIALSTAIIFSWGHVLGAGDLDWPEPVTVNRPGTIWWWMGSAVDRENITWNLETMRQAGIGGVSIVPIYGVKGYEEKYIKHLSPEWLDMMTHAVKEAERLDMWADLTPGTGWPFGGPMITDADCDATVIYDNGKLSQKFSGRMVKRAAPGGEGKAINPYSSETIAEYLKHFDRVFDHDGLALPRALYHDSFEFSGNWHKDLPEAFNKRRGYDLTDHLPVLFGEGDPETVARIKCDYRETLSDLHLEYMETFERWAFGNGCTVRNQAHGSPSNLLDLYAASGIPETETFGASLFKIPGIRRDLNNVRKDHPQPLINLMASSAAHVSGRPLVASESCTWIRNHFRCALSQVKPEIDQLFLNGINHIFFHGTCYSPKNAPWPGWLFYASLEYNPRNAIWSDAPYLNAYITCCQSILQSGTHDNDVAVYWPVFDIWHSTEGMQQQLTVHQGGWLNDSACGKTAAWLRANGYGFDFISERQVLAGKARSYKAVIVPRTGHIPLATLRKLLAMADSGKPVLFMDNLPVDVPGYYKFRERRLELKKMLLGREKLIVKMNDLKETLKERSVIRESMVDAGLDFIRRTHKQGHHYFVANMSDKPVDSWIALGKRFKSAVIMDAYSERTGIATVRHSKELFLQLLPGETRIIRTFSKKTVNGIRWPLLIETGDRAFTVTGAWDVTFVDGAPEHPAAFTTSELMSWTELGNDAATRFAGTARYAIEFYLPDVNADDWFIDPGDVRESARVTINGGEETVLYSVPYRASVGRFLKPGRNRLVIEVTNLSANRIRDLDGRKVKWQIFHDINFVNHNYQKFDAAAWPLTPSGLLGPVRLIPMKTHDP